ncbi:MAG: hypothetical protein IJS52_10545 [Bacilli bacterium]|nr:hypothetical protein [Bacilli bacterium]
MDSKNKYSLTLLEDGDIEIHDSSGKRVYHKSFDLGDEIKKNLIDAYEWLRAAENPDFDRKKYAEEQRQRNLYSQMRTFSKIVDYVLRQQKKKNQPVYAIVGWWCGSFNGLEMFTCEGEADLPDLKKKFDEKYACHPGDFGITEQGYTIERIDVGMAFDDEGRPTCRACERFRNGACQLYSFETREPCERFLLRGANK